MTLTVCIPASFDNAHNARRPIEALGSEADREMEVRWLRGILWTCKLRRRLARAGIAAPGVALAVIG